MLTSPAQVPNHSRPTPGQHRRERRIAARRLFFTYAGVRNTHPLVSDPLLAANMLIRLLRGREKKFFVGVERHSNPADTVALPQCPASKTDFFRAAEAPRHAIYMRIGCVRPMEPRKSI